VDDLSALVTLNISSASFMADCANPALSIQDSVLVKEHGGTDAADAATTDTAKEWLDQNSAGSGPYIMTSWAPLSEVVLVANPNWSGETPYYGRILFKHVSDPTTALQMLQTGDADMVPYIDYDLVEMAQADPTLQTFINQSLDIQYMVMTSNCATEIGPETAALLCQPLVRKAIVASVDYEGLIMAILGGYGIRPPSMFPIGIPGVDPAATQGRDLDLAAQYLTEAGYPDGITIDLYYGTNALRDTIAAKLQADLAEANITVNLNPMEQTVYLTEMRAQKLPFCFGGWTPDYIDPIMWTDGFAYVTKGIGKRMWYDNPAAAALGDQIVQTFDPATRVDLIQQLQAVWLEDSASTILYQLQHITGLRADIQGFSYHPAYVCKLYELYE
jgi:peptide/nickel transport system substrate-binding protein